MLIKVSVAFLLIATLSCIGCTSVIAPPSNSRMQITNATGTSTLGAPQKKNRIECTVESNLDVTFAAEAEREQCCLEILKSFRYKWIRVLYHVTDFLRVLKTFQCPQFKSECTDRTYDFTLFTSLAYDRFCESGNFYIKCGSQIIETTGRYQNDTDNEKSHLGENETENYSLIESEIRALRNISLNINDLLRPCIQASLIDMDDNTPGRYYEMKEMQTPFCDLIWCGFPGYAFDKYEISEWTCMPSGCRSNIYVLMVVLGLFTVISVTVNAFSLIIFKKHRRLRDSQGIYKISLAVADLIIGLIVFPSAIETIRRTFMPTTELLHPAVNNGNYYLEVYSFTKPYQNFVGFFNILTNFVAVFTLMVASLDRFMVVFRPLRYNLYTAKSWAIKISIAVWVVGILLSIMPIIHPNMRYAMIAGLLLSIYGDDEIIILSILFVLPMAIVVATHVATIVYSRRNSRACPKSIANGSAVKDIKVENRLARTLGIMVGAFLLSVLPIGLLILAHPFLDELNYTRPESLNKATLVMFTSLEYTFCLVFLSNSIWNFIIYNARSAEFRGATRKYFNRLKTKMFVKCENTISHHEKRRKSSAALSSTHTPCNTASTALNL